MVESLKYVDAGLSKRDMRNKWNPECGGAAFSKSGVLKVETGGLSIPDKPGLPRETLFQKSKG